MPAGSITVGPKSVTQAMGAASLHRGTIASAIQAITSTVVKAPLVRASLVKRRYTKYLALPLPLLLIFCHLIFSS